MSIEGPKGSGGSTSGQQIQNPDDTDGQLSNSESTKGSAFIRSVVKLENPPSLLKKFDDNPELSKPGQTPIGERRARFAPKKLKSTSNLTVAADFPGRSTANRLNAREASFHTPDSASYENKKLLQETRNTYLSAGLSVLQELQDQMDVWIHEAKWQDPPDENAINTFQDQRRRLKALAGGFRSNINDVRVMSIKSQADMLEQFSRMQNYPEKSGVPGWQRIQE